MKQPMIQNQHGIRTAAYCRLSKDDEQIGESASIQTQRDMILYHIRQNGWSLVDVYIDDGYTGLNTNRPSFQRMLRDIEAGKIDIVVTKDLSRLGRNYVQTGFYIEEYFPKNHVRYIALNDSVDTTLDNNDIAPFKNILNEFYSRDVSKKIRSARQIKAHQGVFSANCLDCTQDLRMGEGGLGRSAHQDPAWQRAYSHTHLVEPGAWSSQLLRTI